MISMSSWRAVATWLLLISLSCLFSWRSFQNIPPFSIQFYGKCWNQTLLLIMSAIKKALRTSISRRRYSMFEQKENDYINTPKSKKPGDEDETGKNVNVSAVSVPARRHSAVFRRGAKMRRSMRDAVGTIRQVRSILTLSCIENGMILHFCCSKL